MRRLCYIHGGAFNYTAGASVLNIDGYNTLYIRLIRYVTAIYIGYSVKDTTVFHVISEKTSYQSLDEIKCTLHQQSHNNIQYCNFEYIQNAFSFSLFLLLQILKRKRMNWIIRKIPGYDYSLGRLLFYNEKLTLLTRLRAMR